MDKVHKLFSYYHTYEKEIADMKYNMGLDTKNIDSITSMISYHITNLNQIPSYEDISGIDEAISFTLEDSDIIMTDNSTLDYFFSQLIVQIHQHCKDKNQRINKKKTLWKVIYGDTKDKNNLTKKQQILFHYFIDF